MPTKSECSFTGCGRPHYARTLCHTHYWQMRRGGPLKEIAQRRPQRSSLVRDKSGRKECSGCGRWAAEAEFATERARADGLTPDCKACRSARIRAWKYGVSAADVERMIASQSGECALCPAPLVDGYCIDHDHACCSGVKTCGRCLRGLLCQECNKLLGKIESDPSRLNRMLAYIGR